MIVAVREEEWWPVYQLIEPSDDDFDYYSKKEILIDVDLALMLRYQVAMDAFEELVEKIGELVYANRKGYRPGVDLSDAE